MDLPGSLAPGWALIFDVDGVIIHSTPLHNLAWEQYLDRHGIPSAGIQQRMFGKHNDEIVRDLFGPSLDPAQVLHHGAAKESLYRDLMRTRFAEFLVPGIADFVRAYGAAPKAVASNAEPANVRFVLDGAGIANEFPVVVDGSQVARPKPHPDVYLEAARRLAVPPGRCVVFEDSPVGIAAARSAGMRIAGLRTTLPELQRVDYEMNDFLDPGLHEWLSRLTPRT